MLLVSSKSFVFSGKVLKDLYKDHLETWTNGLEGLPTNHTIIVPRSHSEGSFLAFHVLERLQDSFF